VNTKRIFLIIIAILISHISAQQSARLTIAINDLKGTGVDPSTAAIISERLRSELINTGAFRVMERAEMESILKEQGFQQSGACDESSCLVQVGQLLGVNRMVAGSIGSVGTFWTISLRMFKVETGEILFTINEDYEGDIKGVISVATAEAAAKLVSGAGTEIKQAALAGKKGELSIVSSETGAKVEIDGKAISGVTPLTLQDFPAGDHEIIVRKGTSSGTQKITLKPDVQLKLNITMQKDKGTLTVQSEPVGVSVFLTPTSMSIGAQLARGKPSALGKTPYQADTIDPGEYWLLFRKNGYSDDLKKVSILSNQITACSDTIIKACRFLTIDYGITTLKTGTLSWKEDSVFDLKYQNLQWETTHFGLTLCPIRFYSPVKGMNSFMLADEIGLSVDQSQCTSDSVRKIDNIRKDTTKVKITSRSLELDRFIADIRLTLGYRWKPGFFAIEPYTGFDFRIFNLVRLHGDLIDSTDNWVLPNMRFAFPIGTKIYLNVGNTALVLGFEYNADMTFIKMLDDLNYDDKLGKNITGGFSSENVSSFVFSIGATF